ncbi:MAG: site-2 protease family protein [Parcubacteria group bacterium SW_6_46_9]|nr:MAG: site-2 protease family protein [Parcubacteria group bacterium SW_6_46_9]
MDVVTGILFIAVLIISVIIHEVSHGYMADYLGDPTARLQGRLTMNPIPHIDPVGSVIVPAALALLPGGIIFGWAKPVPYNPHNLRNRYGDALVAAAGPASNLVLAVLSGLVFRLAPVAASEPIGFFLLAVVLINIILMVFNLVPIPPLDGSKILFEFLPAKFDYIRKNLEQYGFVILLFLVFTVLFVILHPIYTNLFELLTGEKWRTALMLFE